MAGIVGAAFASIDPVALKAQQEFQVSEGDIEGAQTVPIQAVRAATVQPRTNFGKQDKDNPSAPTQEIKELAASIKKHGILQPLLVRPVAGREVPEPGSLEIVAGERRFRAATLAGLENLPVLVRDISDDQRWEIALIENIQRQNLTAAEECAAVIELQRRRNYSKSQLQEMLGQGRGWVDNRIQGAKVKPDAAVLMDFEDGLSKALLADKIKDTKLRRQVIQGALDGLSVRALQKFIAAQAPPTPPKATPPRDNPPASTGYTDNSNGITVGYHPNTGSTPAANSSPAPTTTTQAEPETATEATESHENTVDGETLVNAFHNARTGINALRQYVRSGSAAPELKQELQKQARGILHEAQELLAAVE